MTSERNFTRGYDDRHWAILNFWFPRRNLYSVFAYSNYNIDKIAAMLRFTNRLIVIPTDGLR